MVKRTTTSTRVGRRLRLDNKVQTPLERHWDAKTFKSRLLFHFLCSPSPSSSSAVTFLSCSPSSSLGLMLSDSLSTIVYSQQPYFSSFLSPTTSASSQLVPTLSSSPLYTGIHRASSPRVLSLPVPFDNLARTWQWPTYPQMQMLLSAICAEECKLCRKPSSRSVLLAQVVPCCTEAAHHCLDIKYCTHRLSVVVELYCE